MYRIIAALFLLLASTAASSAQGLYPSVWQTQRGGLLKVLGSTLLRETSRGFSSPARGRPVREFLIILQDAFEALRSRSKRGGTGRPTAE